MPCRRLISLIRSLRSRRAEKRSAFRRHSHGKGGGLRFAHPPYRSESSEVGGGREHSLAAWPPRSDKCSNAAAFMLKPLADAETGEFAVMSLSAEEYRDHLATTAVRAGFSFDGVVLPENQEVHVGRMRLHYLDWGNKHLPPMVFLHGGALNAHTWDLVCLALRDEYRCIALAQR